MNIGDYVLVQQQKHNKFTPNFDPKSLRITKMKGTVIHDYSKPIIFQAY